MTTWTAMTTVAGKARAEALGEALELVAPEPTGVGVFEIEDGSDRWEVSAFFEEAPDIAGLALLEVLHAAAPFAVSELPETDWVAHVRRELHPVEAGRFFVHGSHDAGEVPEGRVPLLIEASMAFGTGHHATTQGCLVAADRLAEAGAAPGRVADIGCGTAVLAMAAAHLWPEAEIIASDIDATAVEVAETNAATNGLAARLTCVEAAGFNHPALAAAAPFGLIFANILKGPLVSLAPDLAGALAPDGHAILSGILNEQVDEVLAAYAAQGLAQVARDPIGDWTTLTLRRG